MKLDFLHKNNINNLINDWHRRANRLIDYLNINKNTWKDKILFVSVYYNVDTDNELKKIAEDFPNLHQLIDIFGKEKLYENIIPSKNTILFNKHSKKMINISNYIISNYFNFIKNDYEN